MRTLGYLSALTASVALLLWADRSTSDVANQAALLVLLVACAALGFAVPRRAWVAGLVVGVAVPVAHVIYLTVGPALPYKAEPAGLTGAVTLSVLVIPAMIAAYLGAGAAWLVRRTR